MNNPWISAPMPEGISKLTDGQISKIGDLFDQRGFLVTWVDCEDGTCRVRFDGKLPDTGLLTTILDRITAKRIPEICEADLIKEPKGEKTPPAPRKARARGDKKEPPK